MGVFMKVKVKLFIAVVLLIIICVIVQSCNKTSSKAINSEIQKETTIESSNESEENNGNVPDNNSKDIIVNNGGTVVEYNGVTYLTLLNEETEDESIGYGIYELSSDKKEKIADWEIVWKNNLYIVDNYVYYMDFVDGEYCILKVSLSTLEKTIIQKGILEFFDIVNKEIYYSINESVTVLDKGFFKANLDGEKDLKLCESDYLFIKKVEELVYLQQVNESGEISLYSVKDDGTEFKKIISLGEETNKKYQESRVGYEDNRMYGNEIIFDLEVYDDWLIITQGTYQGRNDDFFGGTVKLKKDGSVAEELPIFDANYVDLIGNELYYTRYYNTNGKKGAFKYNLDTDVEVYLGDEITTLESFDEDVFVYKYAYIGDNKQVEFNDLKLKNINSNEDIMLFEGENAPIFEDSNFVGFDEVEIVGDHIYFNLFVMGYAGDFDSYNGHFCFMGKYRVKKDGSELELLLENEKAMCPSI